MQNFYIFSGINNQHNCSNLNTSFQSQSNFNQLRNIPTNNVQNLPLNPDLRSLFNLASSNNQNKVKTSKNKKKKAAVRMRFTQEEDQELIRLISVHGDHDWNIISSELSKLSPNNVQRTSRQCKDRYINYLSPEIKNSEWTQEEDQLLILHYLLSPYHWRSMKSLFPGRSEVAIKNRFNHLYKDGMRLLKPMIETRIPKVEANSIPQNTNLTEQFPKSNESPISNDSCQFLKHYNLSDTPFNLNSLKLVIKDLFHQDSNILNQLFKNNININFNQNIINDASAQQQLTGSSNDIISDSNNEINDETENRTGLFDNHGIFSQPNNLDEILQLESENESFDALAFLEM